VEPALALVGELRRLGLVDVDPSADASAGAGEPASGISFAGVELSTEQVSDRVAFVGLEGEVAGSPGELLPVPLLDLVPLPGGASSSGPTALPPGSGLAVVVEDGESYVSLWYTVAELARRGEGHGPPGPPLLAPQPSESPEEVGQALIDAVATADAEGALGLLDPVEAAAVYDYSSLFPDVLAASGGEATGDEGLSFDDATVTAEVDGGLAQVTLALTGFEVALQLPPGVPGLEAGELPSEVTVEVVAVEREDGWYLSPTRSVSGVALDVLAGLDGDDLGALLGPLLGPLLGLDSPAPATEGLSEPAQDAPPSDEAGWAEFVPVDDPAVVALRQMLPLDVPTVDTLGHFDDAFRRSGDLTVTRVYGLAIGFADATVTETDEPDGEPVVERFGEDVVIVGRRGGLQITVSVFGLVDTDNEAIASTLYRTIADQL
jgi:hypothetical protein